jgi:hypothetical protein
MQDPANIPLEVTCHDLEIKPTNCQSRDAEKVLGQCDKRGRKGVLHPTSRYKMRRQSLALRGSNME